MADKPSANTPSMGQSDVTGLSDTFASRRYFRKFERITGHLGRVAGVMEADGELSRADVKVLTRYLVGLTFTFRALSMKYLMVGRDTGRFFGSLAFDKRASGFPVFSELLNMANDAQQAERHLRNMPSVRDYKDQMVRVQVARSPSAFDGAICGWVETVDHRQRF